MTDWSLTNFQTPSPSNPSSLKSRYEIRRLETKHAKWAAAIVIHSNLFHSPLWPNIYPTDITENCHRATAAADYLMMHQINSGWSFGVFDKEYKYKREESKATEGKLYWDSNELGVLESEGIAAESARLVEQMDFPLVSVALSYDAFDELDHDKMGPLIACLPHFELIYKILSEKDKRDPNPSKATAHNQVLNRNATSSRRDYEGEKVMSGMARWLMREADAHGWRGIQIETVNDAVRYVWSQPPEPYKGTIVSSFDTDTWTDEEGKKPFQPAKIEICKIYVDLKPQI